MGCSSARGAGRLAYLAEGLRYARSTPAILALIAMNLIVVVFGMPYQTLMPVVAERVFGVGASGLGLLLAASGVGALAGAVVVASLPRLPHPGTIQVGLAVGLCGAMPLGSLPLAWLAERAGAPTALAVGGTLIVGLAGALALLYPAGRRIGWVPRGSDEVDE